ncbi:penicillin-binding protein 1C [Roseobacteraceae bacterium NS-SX3]
MKHGPADKPARRWARRAGVLAAALVLTAAAGWRAFDAWIEAADLPVTLAETSTEIVDRDGRLLRAYPVDNGIRRLRVAPDRVDPRYIEMLLAYEDKRFWSHSGVDPLALLRAAGQALWHRRAVSGGSTLTMQAARLLENGPTGRWAGKLRQIRLALALERRLSKAQILTLYLTHAPFGGNLEGVRAASLAWFGKEPRRLTPAEAALLVALPQSPERRRPDRFPDAAAQARGRVLERMTAAGLLEAEELDPARHAPVPRRMAAFPRLAPHLADRMAAAAPGQQRIALTIDAGVQAGMEDLIAAAARRGGARLSAALIAADYRSGEILASAGSPGYGSGRRQGFVDMTQAVRSPGSTLKPLIYGLAFAEGMAHPETLIRDGPVDFGGYAPQNFDGIFRGSLPVREALQLSLNTPVVRLAHELGAARIMAALRKGGTDPQLPGGRPGLAVALGGVGLSLQELVQIYAGLAAGGQGPRLRARLDGTPSATARMLPPEAAWQVMDILRGLPPPPGARRGVLAYKTGTSYGHRDAWALGWDGRHVIGVWLGRADGTPVPGAFGGELAAPVLFEAFGRLKPALKPLPPPPPATLIAGTAGLPEPLRRFRPRAAAFGPEGDAPQMLFPPDGARLALEGAPLTLKLRGGTAPFLVLANGQPVARAERRREFDIPNPGRGYSSLVVVDGNGHTSRAAVEID